MSKYNIYISQSLYMATVWVHFSQYNAAIGRQKERSKKTR